MCSACDSLMWCLWKKWINFYLHFSRIYHQFNSFFKENSFTHMQPWKVIIFWDLWWRNKLVVWRQALLSWCLTAFRLHAPCSKNCLICSLPSGPLFTYFCNVFIHFLFFWIVENWFCITSVAQCQKKSLHSVSIKIHQKCGVSATLNVCYFCDKSKNCTLCCLVEWGKTCWVDLLSLGSYLSSSSMDIQSFKSTKNVSWFKNM